MFVKFQTNVAWDNWTSIINDKRKLEAYNLTEIINHTEFGVLNIVFSIEQLGKYKVFFTSQV